MNIFRRFQKFSTCTPEFLASFMLSFCRLGLLGLGSFKDLS